MNMVVMMLSSLGWSAGEPPIPLTKDVAADRFRELNRQLRLVVVRAELQILERDIERSDLQITVAEVTGRVKNAALLREKQEAMKAQVEELKKQERQLWEQQPGGILAPPPRRCRNLGGD
jgi:hypothetical protein